MIEKTFKVTNSTGIHSQPATTVIKSANKFVSQIHLEYGSRQVNLKSIMGVMSLGLEKEAVFKLVATGPDEEEALHSLTATLNEEGLAR